MYNTSSSSRQHITFFGRCNSGKSSLINAITQQETSLVSDVAGTTTDPVSKAIELPGTGPAILIDTPGLDDNSILGEQRRAMTIRVIDKTDIAVVIFNDPDTSIEDNLIDLLNSRNIPVVRVISKCDLPTTATSAHLMAHKPIRLSAMTNTGIDRLIARLASLSQHEESRLITQGLCSAGDLVILVMPQDIQAPKGRLIKPQAEVLRELLERGCNALCCSTQGLKNAIESLNTPPRLVITDSQVFSSVNEIIGKYRNTTLLTSFSVLFARHKGDIDTFVSGARILMNLHQSAHILIAEACSHIPQHEDIGRIKLPRLLRQKLGNDISIDIVGGNDFPADLTKYDLVIHCGACMFTRRHVMSRVSQAIRQQVPITNYGIAIAALTGILDRVAY